MTYITPNKRSSEIGLPYQRQLSPGGTMTEFIDGVKGDAFYDGINLFKLFINYSSVIDGAEKIFRSQFFYKVNFHKNLKDPIVYSSAIREEGKFSTQQQLDILDIEGQLLKDRGSYSFWFKESDQSSDGITKFAFSKRWGLIYERISRTFTLLEIIDNEKTELISQNKFTDDISVQKNIVVVWSSKDVNLYCNGKLLSKKIF